MQNLIWIKLPIYELLYDRAINNPDVYILTHKQSARPDHVIIYKI